MATNCKVFRESHEEADLSRWHEALFGVDLLLLHLSPVYYGIGVPHGDGAGVVLVPGFLASDAYMIVMNAWLRRIEYRPYYSGIVLNAECPNLLIRHQLNRTIDTAVRETGGKIHLIGHSLGGMIARSLACQRPDDIASVITLGSPFRGSAITRNVLLATELVRKYILMKNGSKVLPSCYTGRCTCEFVDHLRRDLPDCVSQTAIYTKNDGFVDWKYCMTGNDDIDVEVSGTHTGLAFNPSAYQAIAKRLAEPSRIPAQAELPSATVRPARRA